MMFRPLTRVMKTFATRTQMSKCKNYTKKLSTPSKLNIAVMSTFLLQNNNNELAEQKPKKAMFSKQLKFVDDKKMQLYVKTFSAPDRFIWFPSKFKAMQISKYINENHKYVAQALNWIEFQVLLFNRWRRRNRKINMAQQTYEEVFVYVSFMQALVLSFFVSVFLICVRLLWFIVKKII